MKCPHCGEELPEGYVFIPVHKENTETSTESEAVKTSAESDIYNESPANTADTAPPSRDTGETGEEESAISENSFSPKANDASLPYAGSGCNVPADSGDTASNAPLIYYGADKKKKAKRAYIIAAIVAAVIIAVCLVFTSSSSPKLKYDITGAWYGQGSLVSSSSLTVTDRTITVSETFGLMEISRATYTYSVESSDSISIQGHEFTVEVADGMLIISPGFNGAQQDVWYSSDASGAADADSGYGESDSSQSDSSDGMV